VRGPGESPGPARRPIDDEPTESLPSVAGDTGAPADAPDPPRRRRQLGTSPTERPASAYRPPSSGGKAPRSGRRRRPTFWRELPILIVVALVLTFLIQTFLAKVYVIPSGSMETTLHGCTGCVNDRVLVDKITYRFGDPQPGDVVVFRGPDSWRSEFTVEEPANPLVRGLQGLGSLIGLAPPDEKDFVKRVIAVGGQTVACCDPRNRVLVDDEPLDEPYIYYLPEAGPARQAPFGPVTVPAGELWMMGDSRNNSADSRVPGHGAVPIANVIGQARLVVMPFDRFGTIAAVDPQPDAVGLASTGPEAPPLLALLAAVPLLRRPRQETFLVPQARTAHRRRRGT
jgi:signal peptidase I